MLTDLLLAAAVLALLIFTLMQRKSTMTVFESFQNALAGHKEQVDRLHALVDMLPAKLEAVRVAVLEREGQGGETGDEALRQKLADALAQLGEMEAALLQASEDLHAESSKVSANVNVAESMVDGMIASGDPFNGNTAARADHEARMAERQPDA